MIFCVEDDGGVRDLMIYTLRSAGYEAKGFADGESLFLALRTERPQLIMLDIMLPGADGISILKKLRLQAETAEIPVIMATAKGTEYDRVIGLDSGADDYLSKPFQIGELLARVEAVLRRLGKSERRLEVGDVSVWLDSRQVLKAGQPMILTVKEFDLLVELMRNRNIALYREQLYEKVWKEPFNGETRTLDSHIQRLRKKLGWEERIRTVFRIGYRLEG